MKRQSTPGHWSVKKIDSCWQIVVNEKAVLATNLTYEDANLIAAAPELLIACKLALTSCDPHAASTRYIEAAIAKAEGNHYEIHSNTNS